MPRSGRYYLNLSGSAEGVRVGPRTFGAGGAVLPGVPGPGRGYRSARPAWPRLPAERCSSSRRPRWPPRWSPSRAGWRCAGRLWRPLLLAALVLLLLEVAVRRLVLPEGWRARWRLLRDRRRESLEVEPEYEELENAIDRERRRHLEALSLRTPYRPEDPASRARLYLAALKQRNK